jgi:NitT/TauT family transport system substrate-binding protein
MKWLIAGVITLLSSIAILAWRMWPGAEPLHLAIDPWPSNELLWLAAERGLFAAEGIDIHIVDLGTAGDSSMAFARGKVDMLVTTPTELVHMAEDCQARVLLALDWSAGADVVLARTGVAAVADLRGRAVAYEPGCLTVHLLQSALASAGLDWGDITARPMAVASMNRAFAAGEVDAVVSYPPWSVELRRNAAAQVVFDSTRIPGDICDLLVARPQVLQRHPDLPARLARIWGTVRVMLESDPSAMSAIAAREGMSPREMDACLRDGIHLLSADEQTAFITSDGPLVGILRRVRASLLRAGEAVVDADPTRFLLPPGNRP